MNIKEIKIFDKNIDILIIKPSFKYLFSFFKYIKEKNIYNKNYSLYKTYKYIRKIKKENNTFFIILKSINKFVGTINLFYFIKKEYEVGIYILKQYRRKNIAYNSFKLLLNFLKNNNLANKIHYISKFDNYKSINLAIKLNFEYFKTYKMNNISYVHFIKNIMEVENG